MQVTEHLSCTDNRGLALAADQKNVERLKAERLFWVKQIFSRIFFFFPKQKLEDVGPLVKKILNLSTRKYCALEVL